MQNRNATPQNGANYPPYGNNSPQNANIPSQNRNATPQNGANYPPYGNNSPQNANIPVQNRNTTPQNGANYPPYGNNSPQNANVSPQYGTYINQNGNVPPQNNNLKPQGNNINEKPLSENKINDTKPISPTEVPMANAKNPSVEPKIPFNPQIQQNIPPQKPSMPKNSSNFETKFAKNILGVLAAILIFFGIGSFAILAFDYMTDGLQIAMMFIFSFAFTAVGFIVQKKSKISLGSALFATGIGSIYISLLATYVFFGAINQYVFFVLAGVWACVTIFLSTFFDKSIYCIIGKIGVIISLSLGVANYESNEQYLFLIVYFVILTSAYLFASYKLSNVGKVIITIMSIMSTVIVTYVTESMLTAYDPQPLIMVSATIIIVYNFAFILQSVFMSKHYTNKELSTVLTAIVLFITATNIYSLIFKFDGIINTRYVYALLAVSFVIMFIISEFTSLRKHTINLRPIYSGIVIAMASVAFMASFEQHILDHFMLLPIVVPLMIYGLLRKDVPLYLEGLVIFIVSTFIVFISSDGELTLYALSLISLVGILVYFYKDTWVKTLNVLYISITLWLIYGFISEGVWLIRDLIGTSSFITYFSPQILASAGCLVAIILLCVRNFSSIGVNEFKDLTKKLDLTTRNKAVYIYYRILNFVFLINLVSYLYIGTLPLVLKLIIVLITTAAIFVGLNETLTSKFNKWSGFYLGIKLVLYTNFVLYSFIEYTDYSYLLSLICMAISMLFIFYGFNKLISSFRLFGLYLSLFSILKLILVDLNYENSILRVLSFIISGLFCFVIVFMYNKKAEQIK